MKYLKKILTVVIILLCILVAAPMPANDDESLGNKKEEGSFNQTKAVNAIKETSNLEQQLNKYIDDEALLNGALIGISVRSASTGEKLYDHMGAIRLRPASNLKLLTATAALETLGKDYTFTTEILIDGKITDNKLKGNIYLKGKGDPTLLPSDFATFAKNIRDQGIRMIEGDIIGDDTWYDDVRLSPDLIWSDEHYYYGAQISALTASPNQDYDAGTVIVEVSPGDKVGAKPNFTVFPKTDYVNVLNNAKTVARDGKENITFERKHGTNIITIEGTIPVASRNVKEWMAVWEPTRYALDLFRQALKDQGISWTGKIGTGQTPEKAKKVVTHQSMPLRDLLVPFMKLSNNTIAEILVKEMGKVVHGEGSWEKGLEVVQASLEKIGVNTDTLLIRDGSGISHIDLIPPNEISKLLFVIQKEDWFASYLHALPVAGKEGRMVGGTLRSRMNDLAGRVHAKTGTISGVSTLSGYVEADSGKRVIFSIMLNNLIDEDVGTEIEDKIVGIIAKNT